MEGWTGGWDWGMEKKMGFGEDRNFFKTNWSIDVIVVPKFRFYDFTILFQSPSFFKNDAFHTSLKARWKRVDHE